MKKYRRIEITAFRRRILIVTGDPMAEAVAVDVSVNNADSQATIDISSDDGQEILIEAVRLLEERISKHARQETEPPNSLTFNASNTH